MHCHLVAPRAREASRKPFGMALRDFLARGDDDGQDHHGERHATGEQGISPALEAEIAAAEKRDPAGEGDREDGLLRVGSLGENGQQREQAEEREPKQAEDDGGHPGEIHDREADHADEATLFRILVQIHRRRHPDDQRSDHADDDQKRGADQGPAMPPPE